ncbi:MAG: hypothetical protein ABI673_10355 [Novosphingobium sp.]
MGLVWLSVARQRLIARLIHGPAMLGKLTRTRTWLLLASFALAALWSATLPAPVVEPTAETGKYSDIQLYHDVASGVAAGQSYYQTATTLQRQHHFPTKPSLTVRPPTLAWLAAKLGWQALHMTLAALLLVAAWVWSRQGESAATRAERGSAALLVLLGGAMVSQFDLVAQHELWAGVLVCLAIALRGSKHWPWAVACAAAALAIREMALPFVLLALAFAVMERRRNEALVWLALLPLFAGGMALHSAAVNALVLPGDLASQGWNALRGPAAPLQDLTDVSLLNRLPLRAAYPLCLLALLGWLAAPLRQALFVLLYLLGYALMIALFARTQNFYWALLMLPTWFIGFAFVPRAARQIASTLAGGRARL